MGRKKKKIRCDSWLALMEFIERFNSVDNGYCTLCHGHRLCDTSGNVGKCENQDCLSHRLEAAIRLMTVNSHVDILSLIECAEN